MDLLSNLEDLQVHQLSRTQVASVQQDGRVGFSVALVGPPGKYRNAVHVTASWYQRAASGAQQGVLDQINFVQYDNNRTLISPTHQVVVHIMTSTDQSPGASSITLASTENLARTVLKRLEANAIPWPDVYLKAQLPPMVGYYRLMNWTVQQQSDPEGTTYRKLIANYFAGIESPASSYRRGSYWVTVAWHDRQSTGSRSIPPEELAPEYTSWNPAHLHSHPTQSIASSHSLMTREADQMPRSEVAPFDDLSEQLVNRLASLADHRQSGPAGATPAGGGSQDGRNVLNTSDTTTFNDDPTPSSVDRADLDESEVALVAILTALIMAGVAAGLSLSQAVINAILAALQAGIEVTGDQVADAIAQATAQVNEVDPDDPTVNSQPVDPPLIDSQGDEVPRDGDRYWWGDRWVSRDEAARLVEQERIDLERENAARLARHEAQRDADWETLRRKSAENSLNSQQDLLLQQAILQNRMQQRLHAAGRWLHEQTNSDVDTTFRESYDDAARGLYDGDGAAGTLPMPRLASQEDRERYQELRDRFRRGNVTLEDVYDAKILGDSLISTAQDDAQSQSLTDRLAATDAELAAAGLQVVSGTGKMAATVVAGSAIAGVRTVRLVNAGINGAFTAVENAHLGASRALGKGAVSSVSSLIVSGTGLDKAGELNSATRHVATQGMVGGTQNLLEGVAGHRVETGSVDGYTPGRALTDFVTGAFFGGAGTAFGRQLGNAVPTTTTVPSLDEVNFPRSGSGVDFDTHGGTTPRSTPVVGDGPGVSLTGQRPPASSGPDIPQNAPPRGPSPLPHTNLDVDVPRPTRPSGSNMELETPSPGRRSSIDADRDVTVNRPGTQQPTVTDPGLPPTAPPRQTNVDPPTGPRSPSTNVETGTPPASRGPLPDDPRSAPTTSPPQADVHVNSPPPRTPAHTEIEPSTTTAPPSTTGDIDGAPPTTQHPAQPEVETPGSTSPRPSQPDADPKLPATQHQRGTAEPGPISQQPTHIEIGTELDDPAQGPGFGQTDPQPATEQIRYDLGDGNAGAPQHIWAGKEIPMPRDVIYTPQIDKMGCQASTIAMVTGEPVDSIRQQIQLSLAPTTGRTRYEGMPGNELERFLTAKNMNPRSVDGVSTRSVIEQIDSGRQMLATIRRTDELGNFNYHSVKVDRVFRGSGGLLMTRVIDPDMQGGAYAISFLELNESLMPKASFIVDRPANAP